MLVGMADTVVHADSDGNVPSTVPEDPNDHDRGRGNDGRDDDPADHDNGSGNDIDRDGDGDSDQGSGNSGTTTVPPTTGPPTSVPPTTGPPTSVPPTTTPGTTTTTVQIGPPPTPPIIDDAGVAAYTIDGVTVGIAAPPMYDESLVAASALVAEAIATVDDGVSDLGR